MIRERVRWADAVAAEQARRDAGHPLLVDVHGVVWLTETDGTGGPIWTAPVAIPPWAVVLSVAVYGPYNTVLALAACSPVGGQPHTLYVIEDADAVLDALRRARATP